MRAPDTEPPYPTFSKAQWREIKACLAERGIDLDTTRVGEFVAGEQWWLPEAVAAAPLLLRHALQTMVWLYGMRVRLPKPTPPIRRAKQLQNDRTVMQKALAIVRRNEWGDDYFPTKMRTHVVLEASLTEYDAELSARIANKSAMGGRSAENARTVHSDYWKELRRLWMGITGGLGPRQRQCLTRFLVACTPSGLFPDIPAQELEARVTNFLSNRSHSRK
jgi:hypothetical protein